MKRIQFQRKTRGFYLPRTPRPGGRSTAEDSFLSEADPHLLSKGWGSLQATREAMVKAGSPAHLDVLGLEQSLLPGEPEQNSHFPPRYSDLFCLIQQG